MGLSYFGFAKKINKTSKINPLQYVALAILAFAAASSLASIFTPYTSNHSSIENCGISSKVAGGIDYCDLNLSLSSLASAFGLLAIVITISSIFHYEIPIVKNIFEFFKTKFGLDLSGCVLIAIAGIFSFIALGEQLGQNGLNVMANPITLDKPENSVGLTLSMTSSILYVVAFLMYFFYLNECNTITP